MGEIGIIGVDLAKNVFQVHGAAADGSIVFRNRLSRPHFARFAASRDCPASGGIDHRGNVERLRCHA